MIDTMEYYAGTYPKAPEPKEISKRKVKVYCTAVSYLDVPEDLENYSDIKEWIETNYNLFDKNSNKYIFEDLIEVYVDEIDK
ncbi:MAG: hypothetical protein IKE89_03595 [Bacilli bacterium]|nr:hypothetical protein [Bacilli bacterium]MBR2711536.1 hypothetical protein [Bacilli bacterium]